VVLESIWLVMKKNAEGCSSASGYFRAWLISSLCAVRDLIHLNVATHSLGNVANLASDAIIKRMLLETRKVTEARQPSSKDDCVTLFFSPPRLDIAAPRTAQIISEV